jgi:hypothetical protein
MGFPIKVSKTWEIRQGQAFSATVLLKMDGVAIDVSGDSFAMMMRRAPGGSALLANWTVEKEATTGLLTIRLSNAVTGTLPLVRTVSTLQWTKSGQDPIELMQVYADVVLDTTT